MTRALVSRSIPCWAEDSSSSTCSHSENLSLLLNESDTGMRGNEFIQALGDRCGGTWVPSAGLRAQSSRNRLSRCSSRASRT